MQELNTSADFQKKPELQRLNEREELLIRPDTEGKTYGHILGKRRSEDYDYNTRVFGVRAIGVHGFELPKFQSHLQNYWKKEAPPEQSWRRYNQSKKLT